MPTTFIRQRKAVNKSTKFRKIEIPKLISKIHTNVPQDIHTYICKDIIDHYKPLVRFTIQFLTPKLCVIVLYVSVGTYTLKSISNYRFLRKFSWQFYLLSEFLPERKLGQVRSVWQLYTKSSLETAWFSVGTPHVNAASVPEISNKYSKR